MTTVSGIQACVFDAYGTLFDVHSAVGRHRARLGEAAEAISALWRSKQLEYSWLRSLMGRHADFWRVTGDALDFALDTHGLNDAMLRGDLLAAYRELSCYPEVPRVLARLREAGVRCAILSNGSPEMLRAAVTSAGLEGLLEAVLSVEEVGIFKPDPRVYQLAVDRLAVPASAISFQSSNAWDAAGAASFGFRVVWVNRFGQRPERLGYPADVELSSLEGLPAALNVP